MWKKVLRYYDTIKYLKKIQIKYLIKNRMQRRKKAITTAVAPASGKLPLWIPRLDSHLDYLKRFSIEELLSGEVRLLYECARPGGENWKNSEKSHLWNFNLHYMEYLVPLAAYYRETKDIKYYYCFRDYCQKWMKDNQGGLGDGWHPYTISLRLTNLWICLDGFEGKVQEDKEFFQELNNSMYAQYLHLQKRLEKHLFGNHYFENLKAVMLGALWFKEPGVYDSYKFQFCTEIEEQILPDGVHYERSLMYHKIILEDMMRAAKGVKAADKLLYQEFLTVIQKMADAMYSIEEGMGHTPLFNDAGDNVAKSMLSILAALREEFMIVPKEQQAFPFAGYYWIRDRQLKILMDAGEIAPDYLPGHGHCDCLSFELSYQGHPVFVNSGTGQYQGEHRPYFRSTAAHNTVLIDGEEQSECWGEHRVARRIHHISADYGKNWVRGKVITYTGKCQGRCVEVKDGLVEIWDQIQGHAQAFFHLAPEYQYVENNRKIFVCDKEETVICEINFMPKDGFQIHKTGEICFYAPEFGCIERIQVLEVFWDGNGEEHMIQIKMQEI